MSFLETSGISNLNVKYWLVFKVFRMYARFCVLVVVSDVYVKTL